jgi:hypothetical protein
MNKLGGYLLPEVVAALYSCALSTLLGDGAALEANHIRLPQSHAAPRQSGVLQMDITDQEYTIVSDLTDLDRVRLVDLHAVADEATSGLLRRIIPGQGVPVAAFNSHV